MTTIAHNAASAAVGWSVSDPHMSVVVTLMMASSGSVMSGAGRVDTTICSFPRHSQHLMERDGSSLYLGWMAMLPDLVGGLTSPSMALWILAGSV